MSYQFNISDIGLRLIKAYEGYREQERTLPSGARIVGFGHHVEDGKPITLTEEQAEEQLKLDLKPIEDLVNNRVYASMSQSQFDALCSLAFSIGPDAFLSSQVLHSLNKGKVIAAANGFDAWRMGNIEGQIYIVDSLVRRRTAEKALFLRPTQRTARAPRYELVPIEDQDVFELSDEDATPVYVETVAEHTEAYQEDDATMRRSLQAVQPHVIYEDELDLEHEEIVDEFFNEADDLAGQMQEQEIEQDLPSASVTEDSATYEYAEDNTAAETIEYVEQEQSPIAAAAAEVSERLDALIDNDHTGGMDTTEQLPSSFLSEVEETESNVIQLGASTSDPDIIIDELDEDDALREQIARENQYNVDRYNDYVDLSGANKPRALWPFVILFFVGLLSTLMGLGIGLKGSISLLGENGPFITIAAIMIGVLLLTVSSFYLIRAFFKKS